MGMFSPDIKTKDDLFMHTLEDIYYAERKVRKAMPDMIRAASHTSLKTALTAHLEETEGQITRLEDIFRLEGREPKGTTCEAIEGILSEMR